jgi:hypothetical protein
MKLLDESTDVPSGVVRINTLGVPIPKRIIIPAGPLHAARVACNGSAGVADARRVACRTTP